VEFEPSATSLESEQAGYVVASLGIDSGYVPYTAFSAKESYINDNPQIIQSFTNALQKGMQYVNEHTSEEIAKTIAPQFPDTEEYVITAIVERYQKQDTWKEDVIFTKDAYTLLLDILDESNQLTDRPQKSVCRQISGIKKPQKVSTYNRRFLFYLTLSKYAEYHFTCHTHDDACQQHAKHHSSNTGFKIHI